MADLSITINHRLTEEEALKRTKKLLPSLVSEHGDLVDSLTQSWEGNTGKFSFQALESMVTGKLIVGSMNIRLRSKIPVHLTPLRDEIKLAIKEKALEIFSP